MDFRKILILIGFTFGISKLNTNSNIKNYEILLCKQHSSIKWRS